MKTPTPDSLEQRFEVACPRPTWKKDFNAGDNIDIPVEAANFIHNREEVLAFIKSELQAQHRKHEEEIREIFATEYRQTRKVSDRIIKKYVDEALQAQEEKHKEERDSVYKERDMLVCALSKQFPSYLARHSEEEEWDDDWRWIVYIDSPTGQLSWHIHDSEKDMFDHLEEKEGHWDGHSTEEKYERLKSLANKEI